MEGWRRQGGKDLQEEQREEEVALTFMQGLLEAGSMGTALGSRIQCLGTGNGLLCISQLPTTSTPRWR